VKHERNDRQAKHQKMKEITVSSDKDPSPPPLPCGDEPSANVDCSALSTSSVSPASPH
jgi:hypothetical protein